MDFALENAEEHFREFWKRIGAEGDLDAALAEWKTPHNATVIKPVPEPLPQHISLIDRVIKKLSTWASTSHYSGLYEPSITTKADAADLLAVAMCDHASCDLAGVVGIRPDL